MAQVNSSRPMKGTGKRYRLRFSSLTGGRLNKLEISKEKPPKLAVIAQKIRLIVPQSITISCKPVESSQPA